MVDGSPTARETMITPDPDDTTPRIEHAVRYTYPADHPSPAAGATDTDIRATRHEALRQARWHRRNGATVEISARTWTASNWRPVCSNCADSGVDSTDHGFEGQPAEVHPCGSCGGRG
jgi:hypothetical protein